jgi:alanyl-tRNA synthetase
VVEVPGFSKELCGGTHVPATGSIGAFKIVAEGGIAAGVRRLEAVTGPGALARFRADEQALDYIQSQHKVSRNDIAGFLEKLQSQVKDLHRQISELKTQNARWALGDILQKAKVVSGVRVLSASLPEMDRSDMRSLADELCRKLGSGVVVLGSPQGSKAALIVMVSEDLCRRIPAGKIIKEIAPLVGGSGGGKAELAEAGGKDSSKLADAIERSYSIIESMLTA